MATYALPTYWTAGYSTGEVGGSSDGTATLPAATATSAVGTISANGGAVVNGAATLTGVGVASAAASIQLFPFPTTSVLDNFNRADAGTLGANWTTGLGGNGITANTAVGTAAGFNISAWNAVPASADVECYITLAAIVDGDKLGVYVRWDGVNGHGYGITAHAIPGGHYVNVYRTDAFADTNLLAIPQALTSGDALGMSMVGSLITVYYKTAAGTWRTIGTFTDATYNNIGPLELLTYNTTGRADNFSGGVYTPAGSVHATAVISLPTTLGTSTQGTISAAGQANKTLTGVSAPSAAGTISTSGQANKTLAGATATAAPGTITTSGKANTTLTSAATTSAVGAITATGAAVINGTVTLTGATSTSSAGTVAPTGAADKTLTGAPAAASTGTLTATGSTIVNGAATLVGAASAASSGTISAMGAVVIDVTVALVGVEVTSAFAAITATAMGSVTVPGAAASASAGIITSTGVAALTLLGAQAVAAAGLLLGSSAGDATLTGRTATASAGIVAANGGGITWPPPAQVLAGVAYGPTGAEYLGTYTDPIRFELESGRLVKPIGSKLALLL